MIMGTNHIPHIPPTIEYAHLRTGGSLKDGWSYVVPADRFFENTEVSVAFSDEDLEDHVREQASALKALYLSSRKSTTQDDDDLEVESERKESKSIQFIVKRGLQVVGVATYSQESGHLTDVAIRPSAAADKVGVTLMASVRSHAKKMGRSNSLVVLPRADKNKELFERMGFSQLENQMIAQID